MSASSFVKNPSENPEDSNDFDVVLSGGGPVALASALEAIKLGKRVAVISDRDIELNESSQKLAFSRGQRIFLDEQSRYYLMKMFPLHFQNNPDDVKFLQNITNDITIRVREIERFLFRRIDDERKKQTNIVKFFNRSEINTIDMQNGKIEIGGSKKYPGAKKNTLSFQYVIGADGASHHAVNKLNEDQHVALQDKITHKQVVAPKHAYHAAISFNIRKKDGSELKLPSNQFIEVATKLNNNIYLAGISLNKKKNDDNNTIKCVFGGEVPKHLFDNIRAHNNLDSSFNEEEKKKMQDSVKEYVLNHLKMVITQELNINTDDLIIEFRTQKEYKNTKGISKEAHDAYQQSKSKLGL